MKTKRQIEIERNKLIRNFPDEVTPQTWMYLGMIDALDFVLENKEWKQREDLLKFKALCQKELTE